MSTGTGEIEGGAFAPTRRDGAGALRVHRDALRQRRHWTQLAKFCTVGASGYVVNLAVYVTVLRGLGLHYVAAATISFLVAATNNYTWNRLWTFRRQRGHVVYQGMRFVTVAAAAYAANVTVLAALVALDVNKLAAQAIAIILVTPLNFVGNKLWSFGRR